MTPTSSNEITRCDDKFACRYLTITNLEDNGEGILAVEIQNAIDAKIHVLIIKLILELGRIIPSAMNLGFEMHHADKREIQMFKCLRVHDNKPCSFPPYKTLSVGVTVVIFNHDLSKMVTVIENQGSSRGGKAITGSVDYGDGSLETPLAAAIRETKEEVGLDLDQRSIINCGRLWTSNFRGSCPDLNEIFAIIHPEELPLAPEDGEIVSAEWKNVHEVISENPSSVSSQAINAAKIAVSTGSGYVATNIYWGWDKTRTKPIEMFSLPVNLTS